MIDADADGVLLQVRVVPRAGRSGLAGTRDDKLLVRVTAAPVDGAANAELIDTLAAALGVPRRQVTLLAGERARHKRVRIAGVTVDQVEAAVAASALRR